MSKRACPKRTAADYRRFFAGRLNIKAVLRGNCYLYEKLGYHQTGKTEIINDKMTIVFYEKD